MRTTRSVAIALIDDTGPPSPKCFTCRNCGGGDRGRVAIYRSFGEFRRAKSYCHLYGAQGQRQALAHATMNFVGLDLTTSDRPSAMIPDDSNTYERVSVAILLKHFLYNDMKCYFEKPKSALEPSHNLV
ncbi:hypothetical protein TNCV_4480751 [Trichonephila clavipes]|nr:hypothetical protein TNCV_4480751 [Trichonephila clavipes]